MKRTLLALLLSPICTNAQLFEVNLNAGADIHTFKLRGDYFTKEDKTTPTVGYATSISATVKLPRNLRVGLSMSSYRIGYRYEYMGLHPGPAQRISMKPFLFEVLALSRNYYKKFNLDLGVVGGICVNKTLRIKAIDYDTPVRNNIFNDTWITYGLLGSLQFSVSKRLALGAEMQPKFIYADIPGDKQNIFVLPVSIKGTIRI